VAAPDEPGLLAALLGQRADLLGVKALLAEGGIVERQPGDLRDAARRHGFRPAQVRRLLMVRELARRWHIPADSAAPAVTSPREALLQFQDLRSSPKECFSVSFIGLRSRGGCLLPPVTSATAGPSTTRVSLCHRRSIKCGVLTNLRHSWLFPQLDAVLHHGGAGTTGASLRGMASYLR